MVGAVGVVDPMGADGKAVAEEGGAVGATLDNVEVVALGVTVGDAHPASSSEATTTSDGTTRRRDSWDNATAPAGVTTGQS